MPEAPGKIFRNETGRTAIRFETAACSGCHGCASPARRHVDLGLNVRDAHVRDAHVRDAHVRDAHVEGAVTATISTAGLLSILFHSLVLPLAGFVAGVSLAAVISAGDLATALLGAVGFAAGVACCRRQTEELIKIEEVRND